MNKFGVAYFPIVMGTICGLSMLSTWALRTVMLAQPAWVLGMFSLLALVAGFVVGGRLIRSGEGLDKSVRMAGKSAVIATLVASACFALMVRTVPGEMSAACGIAIPLVGFLPAILVGTMGAVLGALTLGCQHCSDEDDVELALIEPPRYFNRCFWGTIFTAVLVMVLCSLSPTHSQSLENTGNRAAFYYRTPEALKTAPASAWELQAERVLGNLDPNRAFAISKDERFVAGANGSLLTVYDLESDAVQVISPLPFPMATIAFNPAGDRLFFVSEGEPRRIGVVELKNQRVVPLPQPKKRAVPAAKVIWWSEKEVVFASNSRSMVTLDLDSLELDLSTFSVDEGDEIMRQASFNLPRNERWALMPDLMRTSAELPETEGVKDWPIQEEPKLAIKDAQRSIVRLFPEISVDHGDQLIGMKDGSKVLRFRNSETTAFYFGTRAVPPLRWRITMPHGPERLAPSEAAVEGLALNELYLMLYAPLINPLTNTTVGPDRTRPKALLRVENWKALEAKVWICADCISFTPGDVLADVHRLAPKMPPELLRFEGPHRWWIVAPKPLPDASEVDKIPLLADLETSRKAAQAKAAETSRLEPGNGVTQTPFAPKSGNQPSLPSVVEALVPMIQKKPTALETEISAFVLEHHAKASRNDITEFSNDYAQRVDHLKDGTVDRYRIYIDEVKEYQNFSSLKETVEGAIAVTERGQGQVQATYVMRLESTTLNQEHRVKRVRIILDIQRISNLWQITRDRSEILK